MTPLSTMMSFLEVFAAFLTFIVGYLVCLVGAILILIIAEFTYEGARRVREHVHRIN
jgi:hypothetical protein